MISLVRREMLQPRSNVSTRRLLTSPPLLSPLPLPSPREVHFWYVVPEEVNDASLLHHYMEILSPDERQHVLTMREDRVRKCALLSRALVRTTLARYTNCKVNPRSLNFRKNGYGKPEVIWEHDNHCVPPSLHFNVSHTSSLIACGVTLDVRIGIDIEEKQRKLRNNILSIAHRYFSPSEVDFLHSISDPGSQQQEFVKLWTLKEAYVKALGRGISAAPFRDFTIRFEATKDMQVQRESEHDAFKIVLEVSSNSENLTTDWEFALFELDGSHYAAICKEKDIQGSGSELSGFKVWKTLPFAEDECVSGTDAVKKISRLS